MMTTLTTILGCCPWPCLGRGRRAALAPRHHRGLGLFLSTLLTLVVIPAVYMAVPSRVTAEETGEAGAPVPEGARP